MSACAQLFPNAPGLVDRSQYLPFAADLMKDASGNPAAPAGWGGVPSAVFATTNAALFQDPATGLPLDNGFATWSPNAAPLTPYVPQLGAAPTTSQGLWMTANCPAFQAQQPAFCMNSNIVPQGDFVPLCANGTAPKCSSGSPTPSCSDGSVAMMVAPRYVPLLQQNAAAKFAIIPQLDGAADPTRPCNSTGFSWPTELAMCLGAPCGSTGTQAPVCMSNYTRAQQYQVPYTLNAATPTPTFLNGAVQCPAGTVAACQSSDVLAEVQASSSVKYAACQLSAGDGGVMYAVPQCKDASLATWGASGFACGDGSTPGCGSAPVALFYDSVCSDASAPVCVSAPACPSGQAPAAPSGYALKQIYQGGAWQTVAVDAAGNQVTPSCGYFGVKQADLCACACFVDASGASVPAGPPTMQNGQLGCPDGFAMNCDQAAVLAACVDGGGNTLDARPMCANGKQAFVQGAAVVCADNSTPSCSAGSPAPGSAAVCLPSLQPALCYSQLGGGVCGSQPSIAPTDTPNGPTCPPNYSLSCALEPGQTTCADGTPAVCVMQNQACLAELNLPSLGAQAMSTPTDTGMLSAHGVAFCSSTDGLANSCSTIFQQYFPGWDGPMGSGIASSATAPQPQTLLPDPMVAGVLAQGVCLAANRTLPPDAAQYACSLASNPPTALEGWNQAGAGTTTIVPVAQPFALKKINNEYPKPIYFTGQQNVGDYDSGYLYFVQQTGAMTAEGAPAVEHLAGHATCPRGYAPRCPRADDEVVWRVEGDSPALLASCSVSGAAPECALDGSQGGVAPAPAQACMNQVVGGQVKYPGVGRVAGAFTYDPAQNTCVQDQVCTNGVCSSNMRADRVQDYHQGLTFVGGPNYPVVYQSATTMPSSMFGDLGQPGANQRINAQLPPMQPGDNPYFVPSGFKYWPVNSDSSKQGMTGRVAAQTIFNDVVFFGTPLPIPIVFPVWAIAQSYQAANSTFDTTGAGYDPQALVQSGGSVAKDTMESWFAPTVMGPLMSGKMASQGYNSQGSTATIQYYGVQPQNFMSILSSVPDNLQTSAGNYPSSFLDSNLLNPSPGTSGFNLCDQCNYMYCQTAAAEGGSCPLVGASAPFTLGNLPNDPSNASCTTPSINLYTDYWTGGCPQLNWDNCPGRGVGCQANLVCKCNCDGNESYYSRYTYTANLVTSDTCYCDEGAGNSAFCTTEGCKSHADGCSSATNIFVECINGDQVPIT